MISSPNNSTSTKFCLNCRPSLTAALFGPALFAVATHAFAATYYVAPTGDDSGAGSQAQPWRTLKRAVQAANPGDTVLVNSGTYREAISFARSGSAGSKITFKSNGGQPAIIDGQGVSIGQYGALVGFNNVGYIRLEGFEVRNSSAYNVWVGGESHHLELVGLDIHNGATSGIWLDGPKNRAAMSVISGNHIHDHAQGGITVWTATGGYYVIDGNEIWGNKGSGNYDAIQVGGGNGGSHHIVVKNNLVHGNGSANAGEDPIDLGGHGLNHHYLVEGNVMQGGAGSFKLKSGALKRGEYTPGVSSYHIARFNQLLGVAFVNYDFPDPVVMYNNTFVNCGQCIMFWLEETGQDTSFGDSTYTGGDAGRMNWKNNLFVQDSAASDYVLLTAGAGGGTSIDLTYRSVRFQNNMYKFSSGQKIQWGKLTFGPGINDSTFASFKAANAPDYPEAASILTTAGLTQIFANAATGDFHLAAGSPAIDRGTPLTKAVNAGNNSTTLVVDRASYFQDGYCVNGECLNTADSIVVGTGVPVRIIAIDDRTNTITLASPVTWTAGVAVTLPYKGAAPDIGAFEAGQGTRLPAPTNFHILNQ
jgi:hypothetical protein